jgi:hypothetical protein
VWLRQFGSAALVVRDGHLLVGCLLGVATADGSAYVHLVAVRRTHGAAGSASSGDVT